MERAAERIPQFKKAASKIYDVAISVGTDEGPGQFTVRPLEPGDFRARVEAATHLRKAMQALEAFYKKGDLAKLESFKESRQKLLESRAEAKEPEGQIDEREVLFRIGVASSAPSLTFKYEALPVLEAELLKLRLPGEMTRLKDQFERRGIIRSDDELRDLAIGALLEQRRIEVHGISRPDYIRRGSSRSSHGYGSFVAGDIDYRGTGR